MKVAFLGPSPLSPRLGAWTALATWWKQHPASLQEQREASGNLLSLRRGPVSPPRGRHWGKDGRAGEAGVGFPFQSRCLPGGVDVGEDTEAD